MANYLKERFRSFKFAFQGIATLMKQTPNARIHLLAAVIAVLSGFILKISTPEWLAVVIAIGMVLSLEAVNSSIEMLADMVNSSKDDRIEKIKDLSAAAVLIGAVAALAIGLVVFLPKIIELF